MPATVIATVNINIGLGKDNPVIMVRQKDCLSSLVKGLIKDYSLPAKVYSIIMDKVEEQLGKQHLSRTSQNRAQKVLRTPTAIKKSSVSPVRAKAVEPSHSLKKITLKQNDRNDNNKIKGIQQRKSNSPSPFSKSNAKSIKKLPNDKFQPNGGKMRKPNPTEKMQVFSKSPARTATVQQTTKNIRKLFHHLTRINPANASTLSPEYINLKGIDRQLLSELQVFFQKIRQEQFDHMTQDYFVRRIQDMGLAARLGKHEYYRFMMY